MPFRKGPKSDRFSERSTELQVRDLRSRWTSRISNGQQSSIFSPFRKYAKTAAGDLGAIRAMYLTASFGSCAPALRGPTCPTGTPRTRRAFAASRAGSKTKCCSASYKHSPTISLNAASSTSARPSSTAPTRVQKGGQTCGKNSSRSCHQTHGDRRP